MIMTMMMRILIKKRLIMQTISKEYNVDRVNDDDDDDEDNDNGVSASTKIVSRIINTMSQNCYSQRL